jgi:hypothetical protein
MARFRVTWADWWTLGIRETKGGGNGKPPLSVRERGFDSPRGCFVLRAAWGPVSARVRAGLARSSSFQPHAVSYFTTCLIMLQWGHEYYEPCSWTHDNGRGFGRPSLRSVYDLQICPAKASPSQATREKHSDSRASCREVSASEGWKSQSAKARLTQVVHCKSIATIPKFSWICTSNLPDI